MGKAGMAAARALSAHAGPKAVAVWDGAADPRQQLGAARLREQGIRVHLGDRGTDLLGGVRTVVKSPGVALGIPLLEEARRRGAAIVGEFEIGWHLVSAPTVAVTGTNGKSTASSLCMEVLGANGLEPVLSGNTESTARR